MPSHAWPRRDATCLDVPCLIAVTQILVITQHLEPIAQSLIDGVFISQRVVALASNVVHVHTTRRSAGRHERPIPQPTAINHPCNTKSRDELLVGSCYRSIVIAVRSNPHKAGRSFNLLDSLPVVCFPVHSSLPCVVRRSCDVLYPRSGTIATRNVKFSGTIASLVQFSGTQTFDLTGVERIE